MFKIALAQINPVVGNLDGNRALILNRILEAKGKKADLVVFPELALCGYPPEDLLLKPHFVRSNKKALKELSGKVRGITAVVGFVDTDAKGRIYNAAAVIADGKVTGVYRKQQLPNYGVFDEKRYFSPGHECGFVSIKGVKCGLCICEDIWIQDSVYLQEAKAKAKVLINISSSPYEAGKLDIRRKLLQRRARETKKPVVYVNAVGGQDELVFDGGSMIVDPQGNLCARAKQFQEDLLVYDFLNKAPQVAPQLDDLEEIYIALKVGTRDYVHKNGFSKVALGLSGGIDSALVASVAVDALGKDNVIGISMPSRFNSKATRSDARVLAGNLGIPFYEISIEKTHRAFLGTLGPFFKGTKANIAEENIQARIRGNLLMAFSNKFGWLILTTGNKSEMAVGYCTLYGDMSGGYAILKDVFKTKVYELCGWRNSRLRKPLIPHSIIKRAPSAELRAGQTDEASLGAYSILDKVLKAYIEEHRSPDAIAAGGISQDYVRKIIRLVDKNEYKRRQAPPGVKITSRAFGRDWRLPLTCGYKI